MMVLLSLPDELVEKIDGMVRKKVSVVSAVKPVWPFPSPKITEPLSAKDRKLLDTYMENFDRYQRIKKARPIKTIPPGFFHSRSAAVTDILKQHFNGKK